MLEIEDVGIAPDIRAVPANPDRNVTHQRHAFLLCMGADGEPLRVSDPLDIRVVAQEVAELPLAAWSKRFCPDTHGGGRAVFARPLLTVFALVMPADERAMGRVTGQPIGMRSLKVRERLRSGFVSRAGTKCLESGIEELPLEFSYFAVLHDSPAQPLQIVTSNDPIEVLLG